MYLRQRALLAAPGLASLPHEARVLLGEAGQWAQAVQALPGARVGDGRWVVQAGQSARHRLADAAEQRVGLIRARACADNLERAAAAAHGHNWSAPKFFASPAALINHVTGIASSCGAPARVRSGNASTVSDRSGAGVSFAPPQDIPAQLDAICVVGRGPNASTLLQAISLQAMWTNLHPLTDGNGRSGRVLLNLCLWRDRAGSELYLPLNGLRSGYGPTYEIAVRAAEIRGDWLPIIQLFHSLLRSYSQL